MQSSIEKQTSAIKNNIEISNQDIEEIRERVVPMILDFLEDVDQFKNACKQIAEYQTLLSSVIESGNLDIEDVDPQLKESVKVEKILHKWRRIQEDIGDALANFSQSNTPFRQIDDASKEGLKSPAGVCVVAPDAIKHFSYVMFHQLGNNIIIIFKLERIISQIREEAGLNPTLETLKKVRDAIIASAPTIEKFEQYLEDIASQQKIFELLGLEGTNKAE